MSAWQAEETSEWWFDDPLPGDRRSWAVPPGHGTYQGLNLERLDQDNENDRAFLLKALHPEMDEAFEQQEEITAAGGETVNPALHVSLHGLIANQILAGDPPETWQTVRRLAGLGYDWHNVMHMIMRPATWFLHQAMTEKRPPDRREYLRQLAELPGDWHGQVERHLRASGAGWVILRASWYMSNLLADAPGVAAEGRLYAPAGEARIAMIDPRDVGAAAAAVLSSPGHEGQTYLLTGPRAITYAQVADWLSAATGNRVEYIDIPDEAAHQAMIHDGMPGFAAEQIVTMFARLRQGAAAQVSPAVETLTGSAPRDFAAFALDHARLFAPAPATARR